MTPRLARLALFVACVAEVGLAAAAGTAHQDRHTAGHAKKHTPAHAQAHKPSAKAKHAATHTTAAHKTAAHKPAHGSAHKPPHAAAALAAVPVLVPRVPVEPAPKALPKPAPSSVDPNGDGFLNLYVELCVKRIGEIDAFHDKLLREKVPKLQPDSAKVFLAGMAGDAWPVPYQGKMGNFVLVLPEQKNLCMLYARRTDTAAVEQGFAAMVAKAPEPMIATRGPQTHAVTRANGATRTVSTSWAPPGSERRMQFMLTTSSSPDAQMQALGSVAIVVGPEPGPGPDKAAPSAPLTKPSASPAPAPRPRAQP